LAPAPASQTAFCFERMAMGRMLQAPAALLQLQEL